MQRRLLGVCQATERVPQPCPQTQAATERRNGGLPRAGGAAFRQAQELRAYLEAVRWVTQPRAGSDRAGRLNAWRAWAEAQAETLNPLGHDPLTRILATPLEQFSSPASDPEGGENAPDWPSALRMPACRYHQRVSLDPMTYVIDRFDDGWAVLEREDGLTFHVPSRWLPDEASEGDVLDVAVEVEAYWSGLRFVVDLEATRRRREEANALRARLPKGPEGDLDL